MPDYEVIRADHKKDFDGKFGPMRVFEVELQEVGEPTNARTCEVVQKPTTAPLTPGETVTGTITPNSNPDFPPKFKKEFKDGGFSGGGGSKGGGTYKPRDPSEIAGARHAHNLLVAAHSFPPMSDRYHENNSAEIQRRIDDLEAFACVLDEKTAAISDFAKTEAKPASKDEDVPF